MSRMKERKEKLKGSRGILAAKIGIFLLLIVGISVVIYFLRNKLIVVAICVAAIVLIGIVICLWVIFETSCNAIELERVKKIFSLKEGELVEVLFTPSKEESFAMRISLKVQKKIETRYFALLEGETISIVPMIGEEMLEPQKMKNFRTLECQFTPMTETTEEEG